MLPSNANWVTNNLIIGGLPRNKKDFNLIRDKGVTVFVNLMGTGEAQRGKKKPSFDYREQKNHDGVEYFHYPIKDMTTLSDKEMLKIARKIVKSIEKGKKVFVNCFGGHGRSGTLVGIVLHLLQPDLSYVEVLKELKKGHLTRKYKPTQKIPQTAMQFNQLHRIITWKDDIFFYLGEHDPNFVFSNYYQKKEDKKLFEIMDQEWYSNEGFFQAGKFANKAYKNAIREADTAHKAFLLGRMGGNIRPAFVINKKNNPTKILGLVKKSKGTVKRRADWDEVKDVLMIVGLFAKFTQNKDLYDKLLSTGDAKIVEYSPVDKYWGTYWDKKGKE